MYEHFIIKSMILKVHVHVYIICILGNFPKFGAKPPNFFICKLYLDSLTSPTHSLAATTPAAIASPSPPRTGTTLVQTRPSSVKTVGSTSSATAAWCLSRTTNDNRQSSSSRTTTTPLWGQRTIRAPQPPLGSRPHPFPAERRGTVTAPVVDHCGRDCEAPSQTSSSQTRMRMMVRMV